MRSRARKRGSQWGRPSARTLLGPPQFISPVVYKLAHSVNKNNTSSPGFNSEDCCLPPLAQPLAASDCI